MVLSLSGWGAVRLLSALRWWETLREFGARLDPLYLSITGAGWGVAGGVLVWSMWSGRAWSRLAILASTFLWLAEYWIERRFFQLPRANLPFALIASVLFLAVTTAAVLNRSTKNFITRNEEHERQNKHPTSA